MRRLLLCIGLFGVFFLSLDCANNGVKDEATKEVLPGDGSQKEPSDDERNIVPEKPSQEKHSFSENGTTEPSREAQPEFHSEASVERAQEAFQERPSQQDASPYEAPTPESTTPTQPCRSLPAPSGRIVKVTPAQAAQLPTIVAQAKAGTTILLEDGLYQMTGNESQRRLSFRVAGVTMRSMSGDPSKVIIDGEYKTNEMIAVSANNITLAEFTVRRAVHHLIHISGHSSGHTLKPWLYRLTLIDSGQQFVKVNGDGKGHFVDQGKLECSTFEMTSSGRPKVEPQFGGCYTGGIDAHGARGWEVRRNTFLGIYCTNGKLAEHAIHFWSQSRDTLVEQNVIINCARGIGFGLGQSGKTRAYSDKPYPNVGYMGHIDGIIRNNLIHVDANVQKYYDTGIGLEQAHGAQVYHNTLVSKPTFSSIDYRFTNTKAVIQNNLTSRITRRNQAQGSVGHNVSATPLQYFVNPSKYDYHLKSTATKAINKGAIVRQAGLDLDGKAHNVGMPDLGAFEYQP